MVTSPSRSMSLAVAISVPSFTKMPGFSVPVTMSVDSPSRPMEVRPSVPCRWPPDSIQLSMVVLPAFLHMPTMDMVFVSLSRRSSSSCMSYTPFPCYSIYHHSISFRKKKGVKRFLSPLPCSPEAHARVTGTPELSPKTMYADTLGEKSPVVYRAAGEHAGSARKRKG